MTGQDRRTRFKNRPALSIATVAAGAVLPVLAAISHEQGAATAKDVIMARKALMNTIEENTDRITRMISDRDVILPEARTRARNIYVMLTALPHLFPPESNQWKEGVDLDPVADTVAAPEIWTNFDDFYQLASAAAKRADEMSRATSEDEVKSLHRALGNICDLCHALYYKE
jgi:cytochrome c556